LSPAGAHEEHDTWPKALTAIVPGMIHGK
jgi:hypothetical protein